MVFLLAFICCLGNFDDGKVGFSQAGSYMQVLVIFFRTGSRIPGGRGSPQDKTERQDVTLSEIDDHISSIIRDIVR